LCERELVRTAQWNGRRWSAAGLTGAGCGESHGEVLPPPPRSPRPTPIRWLDFRAVGQYKKNRISDFWFEIRYLEPN
jgi:hypothetical protein